MYIENFDVVLLLPGIVTIHCQNIWLLIEIWKMILTLTFTEIYNTYKHTDWVGEGGVGKGSTRHAFIQSFNEYIIGYNLFIYLFIFDMFIDLF